MWSFIMGWTVIAFEESLIESTLPVSVNCASAAVEKPNSSTAAAATTENILTDDLVVVMPSIPSFLF
jgi:hypothetical protein